MSDKHAAAYHGSTEQHECTTCGDIWPSPGAAIMCEMRDTAEAAEARKTPKVKGPKAYVRSEN